MKKEHIYGKYFSEFIEWLKQYYTGEGTIFYNKADSVGIYWYDWIQTNECKISGIANIVKWRNEKYNQFLKIRGY